MVKCCYPGCNGVYPSDRNEKNGRKNPSSFRVPKDPLYLDLWERSFPISNIKLRPQDCLCELHFKKEDIEEYFQTKMPDGSVFRLQRDRPLLKPTAVPCFFPNIPGDSSVAENRIKKLKGTYIKRKKISQLSETQKECKKAKISCPDNETKKSNSSLQSGTENAVMEVIVVEPLIPSFLKEEQNDEDVTNPPISNSKQHIIPESELSATTSSDPVPDAVTENHSKQSICSKILAESPSPDKLTQNYIKQSSSFATITESPIPDTPTENNSKLNSSIKAVTKSSIPDAIVEKYSQQNNPTTTCSPVSDILPDNYSDESNKEKALSKLSSFKLKVNNLGQNFCVKIKTEPNTESDSEEQMSFGFLKDNLNIFETKDSWWRFNIFDDFIVFCLWTSEYTVERRIVVTKDLSVKVFLLDKETTIGCDKKVSSLYDISRLIYKVDNLKICYGTDKKDNNCFGFLQSVSICKKYNLCLNCINWRKEEKNRTIKLLKESTNCI